MSRGKRHTLSASMNFKVLLRQNTVSVSQLFLGNNPLVTAVTSTMLRPIPKVLIDIRKNNSSKTKKNYSMLW